MEALQAMDEVLNHETEDDMQWQSPQAGQWQEAEAENLSAYVCQSCGGEIVTDANTAATSCPFCGNPVVMSQNLSGSLKPDCIIPFQIDKAAAEAALKKHLSGKPLLPKAFKDENHIREVKGVYVPFWLYDSLADGRSRYHATRVRSWSDSRYIYTETCHYKLERAGGLRFANVPVDGSSKMADELMESLEPYDATKAVPFQTAYLAGYYADKYDVSGEACDQRVNQRIKATVEQELRQTISGYTTVTQEHSSIRLENATTRYALYPVWLLTTKYKDKTYLFAVNGQTGKMVGDLPVDWAAFWKYWALISSITCAAVLALSWLGGIM